MHRIPLKIVTRLSVIFTVIGLLLVIIGICTGTMIGLIILGAQIFVQKTIPVSGIDISLILGRIFIMNFSWWCPVLWQIPDWIDCQSTKMQFFQMALRRQSFGVNIPNFRSFWRAEVLLRIKRPLKKYGRDPNIFKIFSQSSSVLVEKMYCSLGRLSTFEQVFVWNNRRLTLW